MRLDREAALAATAQIQLEDSAAVTHDLFRFSSNPLVKPANLLKPDDSSPVVLVKFLGNQTTSRCRA